ncbi:glycosyltransferase family 4 protein [Candidatus Parcubacteria bacterium]|nr:glycosyltransferase family 4 protein [Candidatus Parcubacteria bacterium]
MKIAIVVWDLTVSGGTQRQALELARQLAKQHEVDIWCYCYDSSKCYPELTQGLVIKKLASTPPRPPEGSQNKIAAVLAEGYSSFHRDDKRACRLAEAVDGGYDVVNFHDLHMEKVANRYKQRFPSAKAIWMCNDVPILKTREHYRNYPLKPKSLLGALSAWALHALFWAEERRVQGLIKAFDRTVVLDNRNRALLNTHMKHQSIVIRSGLDTSSFQPKFEKTNKTFTVMAAGIFFRWRRFEDAIDGVSLLAKEGLKVQLNIAGSAQFDPEYGQMLTDRVKALGLEKQVLFLGRLSEADLREHYRNSDVFVFPNHNQTWGLAVFEAIASGTPVIVSKTAGAHEVLEEGKTALLIEPLKPEKLAATVKTLLVDPELRQRLALAAYEFVKHNISWSKYSENMLKVFQGAAKEDA